MKREEEKYKAATESWDKQCFKNQEQKIPYKLGFLEGFDYADQHPRKGLWDAQKVIKFIKKELPYYVELNCVFDEIQVNYNKFKNNFIHDLKKAMED